MNCPSCGNLVGMDAKFCTNCGVNLDLGQTPLTSSGSVLSGNEYVIEQKIVAMRDTFGIEDRDGKLLAYVKKKILKLLGSEWWLEDGSGMEIARIKGNITEHNFTVQLPSGSEIAHVHKKWVSVRDSYAIEILTQDLAPYVVVAYVIAMDHIEWKLGKGFAVGPSGVGLGGMIDDFSPKT